MATENKSTQTPPREGASAPSAAAGAPAPAQLIKLLLKRLLLPKPKRIKLLLPKPLLKRPLTKPIAQQLRSLKTYKRYPIVRGRRSPKPLKPRMDIFLQRNFALAHARTLERQVNYADNRITQGSVRTVRRCNPKGYETQDH